MNKESSMQYSGPSSWKESYKHAVRESDKKKLAKLVRAAEERIFFRGQELVGSMNHHNERSQMSAAAADLLAVKVYKLGWPNPKSRSLGKNAMTACRAGELP
jgi:hypothetical protein